MPPVAGVSDKWDLFVDSLCLRNPHNSSEKLGCSHTRNSQIVHATSSSAEGPYAFSDVAVPPSVNNPAAVYHAQEKLYLLVSTMLLLLLLLLLLHLLLLIYYLLAIFAVLDLLLQPL